MKGLRLCHADAAAVMILLASLAFRFVFVEDARLAGDEATQYATARSVAEFKQFPVVGVNMTGDEAMTPGGLYHLIMAVPFLFSKAPEAAGYYLVVLNLLALFLGYRIFSREFGRTAALAVLILSALNPFSVFFSDRQWNPNLLIPLGFLWVWLLLGAFRDEGRFRWGWLAALLVVSPQIHMSCPHLTIMTVAMIALYRPRIRWKQAFAGIGIGFASYLPYFAVDAMNGWKNTLRIMNQLSQAAAPWYEAFRGGYYQILYAGGDFTYFLGKGFWFPMTEWGFLSGDGWTRYKSLAGLPGLQGYAAIILIAIAVLIAALSHAYTLGRAVRGAVGGFTAYVRREPAVVMAVINIPLLILLMLKTKKAFYPHYSIVLFPLAMVPVAAAVSALTSKVNCRAITAAVLAVVSIAAINQAVLTGRYYRTEESKGSVFLMKEAARTIVEDAGPSSFKMVVDMPGTRLGTHPLSIMARVYHGAPWRETKESRLTYVLAPAGSRHEKSGVRIWEIDGRRLIRKESVR